LIDGEADIKDGDTPIVPVMLFNAKPISRYLKRLIRGSIYANGFFSPVFRRRCKNSHPNICRSRDLHHLEKALDAFRKVGKKYNILGKTKQEIIGNVRNVKTI